MDNIEPVQEENLVIQEDFEFAYFINDETGELEFGNAMREGFRLAADEEIAEYKRNIEADKPPRELSKLAIIDAFISFGKINEALAAINSHPLGKLRWDAAVCIHADDPDFAIVCESVGISVKDIINHIDGAENVGT